VPARRYNEELFTLCGRDRQTSVIFCLHVKCRLDFVIVLTVPLFIETKDTNGENPVRNVTNQICGKSDS